MDFKGLDHLIDGRSMSVARSASKVFISLNCISGMDQIDLDLFSSPLVGSY